MRDLRHKAMFPQRIFVGLVLQSTTMPDAHDNDDDHADPWVHTHVRTVHMHARHAKGPCPARAMAQLLHRNQEDFCLQIDAHMRFRQAWDVYLLQEWAACPHAARALLSTYPAGYQLPNAIPNETRGTLLYPCKFDDDGMLRQKARFLTPKEQTSTHPIPCHLFAAGFCFGPSAWLIRDCPYDGTLHDLFFGEEMSMAIRLYTAGYNVYAPRQTVVYHLWSRAHRTVPANPVDPVARQASQQKVASQWQQGQGLGSERTVQEWAAAVGVDVEKRIVLPTTVMSSSSSSSSTN